MSLFDKLQNTTFNICNKLFGDTVTWQPSAGGSLQTALCLFKTPSENFKVENAEFEPDMPSIEYGEGTFPTLKSSVDTGHLEIITITSQTGTQQYYTRSVKKLKDGKTYKAFLELKAS